MSYTWAKSIDTSTAIRNQGGDTLFPQNSYCRDLRAGPLQPRHPPALRHLRALGPAVRQGPQVRHRECGALNAMAGGWQFGSILTCRPASPSP